MHRAIRGRSQSHNINHHHHLCRRDMSILMCLFSRHNNLTDSSLSLNFLFRVISRNNNIHKLQPTLGSLDSLFSLFSLFSSSLASLRSPKRTFNSKLRNWSNTLKLTNSNKHSSRCRVLFGHSLNGKRQRRCNTTMGNNTKTLVSRYTATNRNKGNRRLILSLNSPSLGIHIAQWQSRPHKH